MNSFEATAKRTIAEGKSVVPSLLQHRLCTGYDLASKAEFAEFDPPTACEMKTCSTCDAAKEESEFHKNSSKPDGLASVCKLCRSTYSKDWYASNKNVQKARVAPTTARVRQNIRAYIRDYLLAHPCMVCGESDILVLEFDHRDRNTKLFNVGNAIARNTSLADLEAEIAKCDVLCANDHRRRTAIQFGWKKLDTFV